MKKLICATSLLLIAACGSNDSGPVPSQKAKTGEGLLSVNRAEAEKAVTDIKWIAICDKKNELGKYIRTSFVFKDKGVVVIEGDEFTNETCDGKPDLTIDIPGTYTMSLDENLSGSLALDFPNLNDKGWNLSGEVTVKDDELDFNMTKEVETPKNGNEKVSTGNTKMILKKAKE